VRTVNFVLPPDGQRKAYEQRGEDDDGEQALMMKRLGGEMLESMEAAGAIEDAELNHTSLTKKPQQLIYSSMKRKTYSKYDLVKVKVYLADHFYIFSRFLISRVLTLIKVKEKDAIRMTLDVKKRLVEENKLEISQGELEQMLFDVLLDSGYGEKCVQRYKMITTFYQKRLPFIIIVAGTECMGKSTLVTQLGDRINISNIVQTSIVHKVMMGLSCIM
jgi:hypothetical protein